MTLRNGDTQTHPLPGKVASQREAAPTQGGSPGQALPWCCLAVLGPRLCHSSTWVTLPTQTRVSVLLTVCEEQVCLHRSSPTEELQALHKNTNFRSQRDEHLASFSWSGPSKS